MKLYRKSNRLTNFDYQQNHYYFVTICTYQKQCWFGQIDKEEMRLNSLGNVALLEINRMANDGIGFKIDNFVIMPNHIHIIIELKNSPKHCHK